MSEQQNKYSLWLVPKHEAGQKVQSLITKLAGEHNTPNFVPHMTVVANIYASDAELASVKEKITELAKRIGTFIVALTAYGYKDEEFRCLYLLARAPELAEVYVQAADLFPQVHDEHFAAMPHISVLYGNLDEATKKNIIGANPITPLTFNAESFDLFLTNNPVESWQETEVIALR